MSTFRAKRRRRGEETTAVLLYSAALAGIAAGFLYVFRASGRTLLLHEIRDNVEHNAARSHATYRLLKKQRRVLHAISEYLLPVPKGVEKPVP